MDHLVLIDERIAQIRKELTELETARAVLVKLGEASAGGREPPVKSKVKPKSKTFRNVSPRKAGQTGSMKERVLEVLRKGPMKSRDIIERVGAGEERQRVYSALNELMTKDRVTRAEDRTYSLPEMQETTAPS